MEYRGGGADGDMAELAGGGARADFGRDGRVVCRAIHVFFFLGVVCYAFFCSDLVLYVLFSFSSLHSWVAKLPSDILALLYRYWKKSPIPQCR
jgi:hypothetical protein